MGNKKTKSDIRPELSEDEIQLLMANTQFDRFGVIEWYNAFLRDCPDGRLDKKEFEKVYKQLYPQGNPSKFSQYVFDVFDEDNSGFISFTEFLLSVSSISEGDLGKRLHMAFKIYDVNSDRSIDFKEMSKVIEALYELRAIPKDQRTGENAPSSKAKAIFDKLDLDESKVLSEDEFVNGCLNDQFLINTLLPPASQ